MAAPASTASSAVSSAKTSATQIRISGKSELSQRDWATFAENALVAIIEELADLKDALDGLKAVTATTTTYTAVTTDDVITGDATGGAYSITLFTAVGNTGKELVLKKIDSSVNAVTVDGNGSETIDGSATHALSSQWDVVEIVSDGSNWLKK